MDLVIGNNHTLFRNYPPILEEAFTVSFIIFCLKSSFAKLKHRIKTKLTLHNSMDFFYEKQTYISNSGFNSRNGMCTGKSNKSGKKKTTNQP